MTTKELYTKDARIWVEHPEKVWESATVTSDYRSGVLIVKLDQSGEIRQIKIKDENHMPPLRNPSLLIGQNDLTSLSYLHEPAVLHNLKVRFCDRNAIYTYCGIVLVAINPYYDLPIYGDETIMAYRGQAMGDLDPHIFAVSEEAYTKLERERRDQSIIVSGESGAGKTVSAKYAMRYFAAVGGNATETHIERKVLASSPIMEAIGNAKTTRNDNSSRFGKFIEIHFDSQYRICGASMRTYLLEKSRVVYQSGGERNYHIFYQLCAAAPHMPELRLDHQDVFHYLNQGGSPNIDGVDDLKAFNETRTALSTLGVTESEQQNMFVILAAILHLGNIDLTYPNPDGDEEGAYINPNDKHLAIVCELLGVSQTELTLWLTHRRIQSAHEVIVSRAAARRARSARDALAKRIYGELFAWLVRAVNRALDTSRAGNHFIGVLDIYGFETFEINSFEQFCINYANEKLQQQFNCHVFKLEQDEYIKEEISWEMIDFYDNQPCIELIEDRLGVLALLDEECRVPQGSDAGFAQKLHATCRQYKHFMKPRFGNSAFIIKHFADDVEYQSGGFLEKNRDTVSEEQVECIKSATSCRLVHEIFAADRPVEQTSTLPHPSRRRATPSLPVGSLTQPARRASGPRQTVGAQFRASLSALTRTLSASTPHYVRCIKPNDHKRPFRFDPARAVNQLRACGVLETIRISAAGFPSRWPYQDFFHRYRLLCLQKETDRANIKLTCQRILARHLKDPDKYQFGATKIFFRAGQVAYLEKIRADIQREYCVMVQSCVRRFVARRRYLRLAAAIRGLQARARGHLARRKAQEIRRERAAIKLQRNIRGWVARNKFRRLRRLAVGIQARARGLLARRLYKDKKRILAVITVQRYARGYLARQKARQMHRHIVVAQSAIRRFLARRQYKRLRIEARSLDHVKTLNKGLENKIISLQQRLEAAQEKSRKIEPLQAQIVDLKAKVELLKLVEMESKSLKVDNTEKDSLIIALQVQLANERDGNRRLKEEKKEIEDRYRDDRLVWEGESEKLANELKSTKEQYELAIEVMIKKAKDAQNQKEGHALTEEEVSEAQNKKEDIQRVQNKKEVEALTEEETNTGVNEKGAHEGIKDNDGVAQIKTVAYAWTEEFESRAKFWKEGNKKVGPAFTKEELKDPENKKVGPALVTVEGKEDNEIKVHTLIQKEVIEAKNKKERYALIKVETKNPESKKEGQEIPYKKKDHPMIKEETNDAKDKKGGHASIKLETEEFKNIKEDYSWITKEAEHASKEKVNAFIKTEAKEGKTTQDVLVSVIENVTESQGNIEVHALTKEGEVLSEKDVQAWTKEETKEAQNKKDHSWTKEEDESESVIWTKEFEFRAKFWKERDKQIEQEKKALSEELEAERQSRQKLLSSQYELQERLDSLQRAPVAAKKEHRRSLSDASNNSQQETTVEDDYGYGSVRSVETNRPALEAVNWSAGAQGSQNGPAPIADAGLVLRMQNRLSALQSELSRTAKRAHDLEHRLMTRLSSPATNPNVDRFKVEELEIENKKLREHLDRLRAAGDSALLSKEVLEQLNVMQTELDRKSDECVQLKSVLSNQTVNLKSLASSNYGSDVDIINEDGELATAYEAQKGINRQLQDELLAEKKFYSEHISKSKTEIDRLREDNDKYQNGNQEIKRTIVQEALRRYCKRLLSADLSAEPKNKAQEFAQNEIIRLAAESLTLQERVDKLSESCRRYKNQIRLLVNKLKEVGIDDVNDILENSDSIARPNASMNLEMAPVTRKMQREYLGMFEYKVQDEGTIIKKLITDLKPKTAVGLLPGLPAYILFMMLRHMDHVDDEPKMHQLMKAVRTGVKKTLKRRSDSVEYNALWLSNMLRLLNNLRQYSGDAVYQATNTPRQNQQCLRIFDLSEYRQVLSDIAVWIYQSLIQLLERQLERLIIPAILEHEEISGLSGPGGRAPGPAGPYPGPSRLKHELSAMHEHLHTFAVDEPLRVIIFKQLFYYICAYSLNQLLLRKDLCCWAKGLQIRYNISHLETWIKEHLAEYGQKNVEEILSVLRPITQAVQLLQARKSMQDVQSTVEMCSNLTAMQVCKILNMYTPAEEYEVKVTREFIHEIQKKMQEKAGSNPDKEPQNLLMDSKMIFSVQFPFNPSSIRLEDVELPSVLELDGLLTKI